MKKIFILLWLVSLMFYSTSFALEKPTHEKLNEEIAPVINPQMLRVKSMTPLRN